METEKQLRKLAEDCCIYLEQLGYSKHGVWANYFGIYNSVARYQLKKGATFYDTTLADEYLAERLKLYDEGKISRSAFKSSARAVSHMTEFALTGQITHIFVKRGTKYVLIESFENALNAFLASRKFHPNTKDDIKWAIRFFLHYFQECGKTDVGEIVESDLKEFVLFAADSMTFGSLNNLLGYVRQFMQYLLSQGMTSTSPAILKYCGKREYHVSGFVSDEDIQRIIEAIDTRDSKGKRNKAIILLGAVMGIRAADIITLKLSDIDWRNGRIVLTQNKTGKCTDYPLTEPVASAIQDYILNARPNCSFEELFLRAKAPFAPLVSGSAVESVFEYQCKVAGVSRKAFDGRAFHGLRRRLGRRMLSNGESITTISQVLGHISYSSAKQYLKIDGDDLKVCALDFRGIGVERRSLL